MTFSKTLLCRIAILIAVSMTTVAVLAAAEPSDTPDAGLRAVENFANISNPDERSGALFGEAMKVITSPRCMNCHPATRTPTQGENSHPHVPLMDATDSGHGPAGLACTTCHGAENVLTYTGSIASVPGHEHWGLAPASMAWQGMTPGAICAQIKDPQRNGDRTLSEIQEHMAKDTLVGWAWNPGPGRTPAPGTQAGFGELIAAWIATGAACPPG
jgi:cytochrome c553